MDINRVYGFTEEQELHVIRALIHYLRAINLEGAELGWTEELTREFNEVYDLLYNNILGG